jgi:hypothetical protein
MSDGVVMGIGVLALRHGGQVQAEGGERAHGALIPAASDQLPAMSHQGVAHDAEICGQLAPPQIVASWLVRPMVVQAPSGIDQLLADAGQLEPVRLLAVQPAVTRVRLSKVLEVHGQRRLQRGGDACDSHRGEKVFAQFVDEVEGVADGMVVLEGQGLKGGFGRDIGVAVAVPADPRAEGEWTGVGRQLDTEPGQLAGERFEGVGNGVVVEGVEVAEGVAGFVPRSTGGAVLAPRAAPRAPLTVTVASLGVGQRVLLVNVLTAPGPNRWQMRCNARGSNGTRPAREPVWLRRAAPDSARREQHGDAAARNQQCPPADLVDCDWATVNALAASASS